MLQCFTAVNVLLNCAQNQETNCHFISGDWAAISHQLETSKEHSKYDLLLSSETIYSTDNYEKLLKLIKVCLAHDGVMFLSSKCYYFGVGGGTRSFEEFVANDGELSCCVCHEIDAPLQREILKLTWKSQ